MTCWNFKLLACFCSFVHIFPPWCKLVSSFYFRMCLKHMNQIKLSSICTNVAKFSCILCQPANTFSSNIHFCWEVENKQQQQKARPNRKKYHHDLISFNYFESYWSVHLIFYGRLFISCVCWLCNLIVNNIWEEWSLRFRHNCDLFMTAGPLEWVDFYYESFVHMI